LGDSLTVYVARKFVRPPGPNKETWLFYEDEIRSVEWAEYARTQADVRGAAPKEPPLKESPVELCPVDLVVLYIVRLVCISVPHNHFPSGPGRTRTCDLGIMSAR